MDKQQKNKFDELYRIIDITAKARYGASTRLNLHGMCSQWTLSLLAIGLIIVSVLMISSVKVNFSEQYSDVMQIVFSVVILTYSLLLGMGNFSARAERLHRCGLELSRLVRRVKPLRGSEDYDPEYSEITKEYYDCLEKYENHKEVDFLSSRLEIERRKGYPDWNITSTKLQNINVLLGTLKGRIHMWISVKARLLLSFSHYAFSVFLVFGWITLDVHKF